MSGILVGIEWKTVFASFVGTTIPGLIVTLIVLFLTRRINRSVEILKIDLQRDIKFSKWHERRTTP